MPDRPRDDGIFRFNLETGQTVTTNITTTMDTLLVLISLSFHSAYAASHDKRFLKRQQASSSLSLSSSSSFSSKPTRSSSSTTTHQSSEHSLPASIQTRIPIPPSPPPTDGAQTAIPEPPGPNSDKAPIIGFSIGIVALVFLFAIAGWILFRRYKQRKQQQAVSGNTVQLQPTNHYASSVTKASFDDTQPAASRK